MARNFRVAILRARHDASAPLIPDPVCAGVLQVNNSRTAVFQFWQEVSLGYVAFSGSRMFPWVDIAIDATKEEERSRQTLYRRAREATEQAGHDLGEYDAFFVLVHPPSATVPVVIIPRLGGPGTAEVFMDVGATADGDHGVAVLRSDSDHTSMCHELGHAIGWNHTFGVWNHGSDWDGQPPFTLSREYGDPYDVMSSATFGGRGLDPSGPSYGGSPAFALDAPPVAGWPDDAPWRGLGPAVAQAHLHLWAPDALEDKGRVKEITLPEVGQVVRVQLFAASRSEPNLTTLAVVHPPGEEGDGRGRYYVEYRDTSGWDRGLETTGDDLSRRAVVLHRLERADGELRCWYQGRIVVPLEVDVDAQVSRLPLSVRVVNVSPDLRTVVVELARTSERAVYLERNDRERVVEFIPQRTDAADTLCGRLEATWGERRVVTTSTYRVRAYGFGGANLGFEPPVSVTWELNGQSVDPGATSAIVPLPAGRTATVGVAVDTTAGTLTLSNEPAEGAYRVEVTATVAEADGRFPTSSYPEAYAPDGVRPGYDHSIQQKLRQCIEGILNRLRVRPREIFIRPFDAIRGQDEDRLHRLKLETIATRVLSRDRALASELSHLIALRYGALPR